MVSRQHAPLCTLQQLPKQGEREQRLAGPGCTPVQGTVGLSVMVVTFLGAQPPHPSTPIPNPPGPTAPPGMCPSRSAGHRHVCTHG